MSGTVTVNNNASIGYFGTPITTANLVGGCTGGSPANRRVFEEELDRYSASDRQLAVIFIDVDYFKSINDEHGHLIGDEVLTVVAQRLRSCVRPTDLVARIGGDEFVILFREIHPMRAQQIGEAIVTAMHAPVARGDLSDRGDRTVNVIRSGVSP